MSIFERIAKEVNLCFGVCPKEITELSQDASMRKYYRVVLYDLRVFLVVNYLSHKASESSQDAPQLDSDLAFLEIGKLLSQNGLVVPKVFFQSEDRDFYILEDLGDRLLGTMIEDRGFNATEVFDLFSKALRDLKKIQNINSNSLKNSTVVCFNRNFDSALYLKEMREFLDYSLKENLTAAADREKLLNQLKKVANLLSGFDNCLVHRDYHSWNLAITEKLEIGILDFQDALLGFKLYDPASLLHDRDTDGLLSEEVYIGLLKEVCTLWRGSEREDIFWSKFVLSLMQRDLKVSGRFEKLVSERGLLKYNKWISGTNFRIGKSINFLEKRANYLEPDFYSLLRGLIPQLDLGYKEGFQSIEKLL